MNSGRLAKNTAALFVRQILILAINLYAIRALLTALGINDFSLFNVILNVVMIGSFLTGALGMIVQRYFSFAIGKGDKEFMKRIHNACLLLSALITALIILSLETVGAFYVSHHLALDPERISAVQVLFQFMVLSFVFGNFTVFYSSIIMAHEDMHFFALFSIIEASLRLGAVLTIGLLADDRLVAYGFLICGVSATLLVIYWNFCRRRYAECRPSKISLELETLREMIGFAGWTVFGQLTTISRNQAVTILINQAFSPATVAARVLAVSVSAQVLTFSNNFSSALQPPIIKAHAVGEKTRMFALIFTGSKITFFLVWMATLPIMATMPGILSLWLGNYPHETVLFTRLALAENAIVAISIPLMTALRATGQMRVYEISLGTLQLLVLVFSWLVVRMGYPAYYVYLVAILINLVMFAARLAIVSSYTGLPISTYLRLVLLPAVLVVGASSGLVLATLHLAPRAAASVSFPNVIGVLGFLFLLTACTVYAIGLTGSERQALQSTMGRRVNKILNAILKTIALNKYP